MTLKIVTKFMAVILGVCFFAVQASAEEAAMKTTMDRISYGMGVDLARNLKNQGVKIDEDYMIKLLRDEFSGKTLSPVSDKELRRQMTMFMDDVKSINVMNEGKMDIKQDFVINGFKDEVSGKKLRIPDRELRRLMTRVKANLKKN